MILVLRLSKKELWLLYVRWENSCILQNTNRIYAFLLHETVVYMLLVSVCAFFPTQKSAFMACLHRIFNKSNFPHEHVRLTKSTMRSKVSLWTKNLSSVTGKTLHFLLFSIFQSIFFSTTMFSGYVCKELKLLHEKPSIHHFFMMPNKGITGNSMGEHKATFIDSVGLVVLISYM